MVSELVSVIIATYNRTTYLSEAIDSVLAQTYPSALLEIIIVDDGSSHEGAQTKTALAPYLSANRSTELPKITYFYQENRGIGSAVNQGLALAKGEFIQRLDDDDRLLPDKISSSVEIFQSNPDVGMVATGSYLIDSEGKRFHSMPPSPCPDPTRMLNVLMRAPSTCAGAMIRSSVYDEVGLYRTDLIGGEDYEVAIRIARQYKIAAIEEPLAEYRRHQHNITSKRDQTLERDLIGFVSDHLQQTPLDLLAPGLKSKAHGHALRAGIYLLRNGRYLETTPLAKKELEEGLKLAPNCPVLSIWKGVLAAYGEESLRPFPWEQQLPDAYRRKSDELYHLIREYRGLLTESPNSPAATEFRGRFSTFHATLMNDTFRKAIGL